MLYKTKKLSVPAHKYCIQIKIALIGDQQAGKTAFNYRYLDDIVINSYEPTLGVDSGDKYLPVKNGLIHVTLWDFSGKLDFLYIRNEFYKEAHLVFLFIDLSAKEGLTSLYYWFREVKDNGGTCPIYLIGSKSDNKRLQVDLPKISKERNCPYFYINSKTKYGINDLMERALNSDK